MFGSEAKTGLFVLPESMVSRSASERLDAGGEDLFFFGGQFLLLALLVRGALLVHAGEELLS